jgi:hypothetical protein
MRSTDKCKSFAFTSIPGVASPTAGLWFINGKFRYFLSNATSTLLYSSTDGVTWTSQDVTASFANFALLGNGYDNSVYDGTNLYIAARFSNGVTGIGCVSGSLFT